MSCVLLASNQAQRDRFLEDTVLHCKDAAPPPKKDTVYREVFLCRLTHNSGPLHRVIRAGAARRSTNASLMPRRTNCKPTIQQGEREGEAGVGGKERTEVKEKCRRKKIEDRR